MTILIWMVFYGVYLTGSLLNILIELMCFLKSLYLEVISGIKIIFL